MKRQRLRLSLKQSDDAQVLSDGEYNYYAIVVWFENSPAFGTCTVKNPQAKVRGISDGDTNYMDDWNSNDWEVIGNIHDNKELLEVQNG